MIADKYHKLAVSLNEKWKSPIPVKDLAFLPSDSNEGMDYLRNMNFCMEFSYLNRLCMLKKVEYAISRNVTYSGCLYNPDSIINIHHNYATIENHFGKNVWIHRKGATSAKEGELGIIPGSMGDRTFIVKGKGNTRSFMSCSHGAGRRMARGKASDTLSLDVFKDRMKDVVSMDVDRDHLDESPMAYKDIEVVMSEQIDLVDVVYKLSPLANIKG